MNNERLEELAALKAINLIDEAGEKELREALQHSPELRNLLRDLTETANLLAYEAPTVVPPHQLKQDITRKVSSRSEGSKIIRFPQWVAYAIAACLMALGIVQTVQIVGLKSKIQSLQTGILAQNVEMDQLRQSNAMKDIRLATLQAAAPAQADAAYASSHIMVAWNPAQNQGVVSMKDLPAPPPGHDYQLWVLDPKTSAPLSAGLITGSRSFAVKSVGSSNPGFAISLEPSGGRPAPTGPILFVATSGQ